MISFTLIFSPTSHNYIIVLCCYNLFICAMDVLLQSLLLSFLFGGIESGIIPHCPSCEDEGNCVSLFLCQNF